MACGLNLEDKIEEDEAGGFSQSACERNKALVPLADLINAGTSKIPHDSFLICTRVWVLRDVSIVSYILTLIRDSPHIKEVAPLTSKT